MHVTAIRFDLIDPPREDDRLERTREAIASLAADIKANGLINPPAIEATGERYECVAGWTRVLACRALHWPEIPAQVYPPLDAARRRRIRLAENLQRSDLSPIEEGIRLAAMMRDEDASVDALATLTRRSPAWVAQRLNLLALPDDLQALVHTRELALGAALELGRCTDVQHRAYLLKYCIDGGATIESVRAWVAEWSMHVSSGASDPAPLPPMPVLNQRPTVTMPCGRCHKAHDVNSSCIIRVCQDCGREIQELMRHPEHIEATN